LQTVVETPSYLRAAEGLFSADEREKIVAMVAADPKCGDIIQGTGGFRKIRVGRDSMGKRGGARVVYIVGQDGRYHFYQVQEMTMATMFEDLKQGLREVDEFLGGKRAGFKVTVPADIDVKSIRKGLHMTQASFSDTFGFSLDAVKHWEGGRRRPEASARAFLTVIGKNPKAVIAALHPDKPKMRFAARKAKPARATSTTSSRARI
jgi:putative transcriptional regulator